MDKREIIQRAIKAHPGALLYLNDAAFDHIKTQDAYFRQLWNRIREYYANEISGGQFLDALANLVQDQITRAYRAALREEGLDPNLVNAEYQDNVERIILSEYDHVDGLAADVQRASAEGAGFEQFRVRAELWANRYTDAYNTAILDIALENGGKLEWELGATEEHCETCQALNGKVAFASEWEEAGLRPQNPPNGQLDCGGWQCDCKLSTTDKRRTKNALATIQAIGRRA